MKKRIFGALFLALVGVGFVSCEKESLVENNETSQNPNAQTQQNLSKALNYNYAIGADVLTEQLLRKKYDLNTSLFSSGTTLDNYLFYGVGAYNYDLAVLEKVSTNQSKLYYESTLLNSNKSGMIKYLGADILMDEVELIDDDINKVYALRGSRIYKLTYVAGAPGYFNATLLYTYPTTPTAPRRFTIAPVIGNQSQIRLYTAPSVMSQQGQPAAMTTLTYVNIDGTTGTPGLSVNVTTLIPGSGNLSSFTSKDFVNATPISSDYFVVVDKTIYQLSTPTTLFVASSFATSVRDCSFYLRF